MEARTAATTGHAVVWVVSQVSKQQVRRTMTPPPHSLPLGRVSLLSWALGASRTTRRLTSVCSGQNSQMALGPPCRWFSGAWDIVP